MTLKGESGKELMGKVCLGSLARTVGVVPQHILRLKAQGLDFLCAGSLLSVTGSFYSYLKTQLSSLQWCLSELPQAELVIPRKFVRGVARPLITLLTATDLANFESPCLAQRPQHR